MPHTSKELRQICKWLKDRISQFDFGHKTSDGPRHSNLNCWVLELFHRLRSGMPRSGLARLNNQDILDHFKGQKTYYFTGNGKIRCREALINIDIDCHRSGSLDGAIAFAEYLRKNHLPGLYTEISTNGNGVHGYLVVQKRDLGDLALNRTLKYLDRWLKYLLAQGKWDVENVEIKGQAPEFHWGNDKYELLAYKSGQLAKLPREALERSAELMGTTKMSVDQLDDLSRTTVEVEPVRLPEPEQDPGPTVLSKPERVRGASLEKLAVGSISGLSIPEELAEQVQGRLLGIARKIFPTGITTGRGRAVRHEDMATFLAILKFCGANPNSDGSMPTERVRALWDGLYRRGYTERAWDHHRYKVLRDWLSEKGDLAWKDDKYIVGREVDGFFKKGQAAKWAASERLLEMLEDRSIVADDEKYAEDDREFNVVDAEVSVDGTKSTVGDPEVAVDDAGVAEVAVDGANSTVVDAEEAVVGAGVVVDNAKVGEVAVDDAIFAVGERVLSFSSFEKGRKETSLWAVPLPGTIKPRLSGWELNYKAPRFAGINPASNLIRNTKHLVISGGTPIVTG